MQQQRAVGSHTEIAFTFALSLCFKDEYYNILRCGGMTHIEFNLLHRFIARKHIKILLEKYNK